MSAGHQHAARMGAWEAQQQQQQNALDQQHVALRRLEAKAEADSQRLGDEVAGFLEKLSQEAAAAQQHNKNMAEVEAVMEEQKKMKRLQELCNALVADNRITRERIEKLESTCQGLQRAIAKLQAAPSNFALGHLECPKEKVSPVHALQEEVLDLRERLSKLEFVVPYLMHTKSETPSSNSSSGRLRATSPVHAAHQHHLTPRTTPNSPRIDWQIRPSPPMKPPCPDRTSPSSQESLKGKPPLPSSMLRPGLQDSSTSLSTPDIHVDVPATNDFDDMPNSAPVPGRGPILRRVSEAGSGASREDRRIPGAGDLRRVSEAGSGVSREDRRVPDVGDLRRVSEAGSGASRGDRRIPGVGELRLVSEAGSGALEEDRRVPGVGDLRRVPEAGSGVSREDGRVTGVGDLRRVSEAGSGASREDRRVLGVGELRRVSEAGNGAFEEYRRVSGSGEQRARSSVSPGSRRSTSSSASGRPSPTLPHSYFLGEGLGAGSLASNVRLPSKRISWGGESTGSRSSKIEELPPKVFARPRTCRPGVGAEAQGSNLHAMDNDRFGPFPRKVTVAGDKPFYNQSTQEDEQELMYKSTEAVHREEVPPTATQMEKLRANAEQYCAMTHKKLVAAPSHPASHRSVSADRSDMGGKMRAVKKEGSILSGKQSDTERVTPSARVAALSPWVAAHARTTPAHSDDGLS
ncbi:hypothetical protein DUNSADRAFT_8333 [Dunaliella salina]|uniref:Uncharacterized protein n=1 Tax=Dunaliella salina TaxID=3046 RepID=A0ABQ7H5X3_DUNSA|nr:hypothetical protein DUNSADRAFT_8333 [Dunaliella salina]|eukprot:KAF5842270.1 hypothetical protein DUNSADRAFT_8333 [Dunaliella salina]